MATIKSYQDAGRAAARQLYPGPLVCEYEGCTRPAERHHSDGDTWNNSRDNIRFLCRKHHHQEDGRNQRPSYRAANSAARRGKRNERSIDNLRGQHQPGVPKTSAARAAMSLAQKGSTKAKWTPERRAAAAARQLLRYAQ